MLCDLEYFDTSKSAGAYELFPRVLYEIRIEIEGVSLGVITNSVNTGILATDW